MKKTFVAFTLVIMLVLVLATAASADNGPHGGYNGSTDACASCHRAHSAVSADGFLLVANDIYELCTSCHDGTGAYTNVVDGYYDVAPGDPGKADFPGGQGDTGYGLFSGGFVNARMLTDYGNAGNEGGLAFDTTNAAGDQNLSATSWAEFNAYDTNSVAPLARPVTSTHDVRTVGRIGVVWGAGDIQPFGSGATLANNWNAGTLTGAAQLECTSCHDPHGNAGRQGGFAAGAPYPSYRLLRFTPAGSNGYEVASEVGPTGYWNTDLTWSVDVGIPWGGTYVIPEPFGVMVPDPDTPWYTVNNDILQDPSLGAYRTNAGNEMYVAISAGRGDYMGRYFGYQRPAAVVDVGGMGLPSIDCGNPPQYPPATSCDSPANTFNNRPPHDVLGFWCATCHDRYLVPRQGGRLNDSTDLGYHYRHVSQATNPTSFGDVNAMGSMYTCVDCHNAHGTAATASSSLASDASYGKRSVLLKADNRAVCIRCHASDVNFFNVVTSPTAPMVLP